MIFTVKDALPHRLHRVLDAAGGILPARQTGRWAEEVLAILRSEDLAYLGNQNGVETDAIAGSPARSGQPLLQAA